jgi:acylphosphatase
MSQIAKHIIFIGQVQGVGFRFTTFNTANRHQLTGFVRNLPDGTVEMLAQGPAQAIDDCIRDIKEYFNDYIRETKIKEIPSDLQYKDFEIAF